MALWIRSQGKHTLMKVNCLRIDGGEIYDVDCGNNAQELAWYSTEKQAMDVLDEIQEKISEYAKYLYDNDNNIIEYPVSTIVYQMPEDKGENYENLH